MNPIQTVLAIGASGSIGRLVVDELTEQGVAVRVLVRESSREGFPAATDVRIADITRPEAYGGILDGIDAVVFTQGSYGTEADHEALSYGVVKNLLLARRDPLRIALMTTIGVTDPACAYNEHKDADWKYRGERLVRASGQPYTIVRPGWFDLDEPDQQHLVFLQGDRRSAGTSEDGVVSRRQIAQVLVGALFSKDAAFKTLELVAEKGTAQMDLDPLFSVLESDRPDSLDGVRDRDTRPLASEPASVTEDIESLRQSRPGS